MSHPAYPDWLDLIWVGVDIRGRLGAFATGGQGPIAGSAFATFDHVGDWLDALTDRCGTRPDAAPEAFGVYARRGLFVFDWSDVHRTSDLLDAYELMAAPTEPLVIDQLPAAVAKVIASTTLGVDLEHCRTFDPRRSMDCLVAD